MIDPLFKQLKAGAFELLNRMVMALLTRCRSSDGRVPNEIMAEYYEQRDLTGGKNK
jgi:2,4-dienoyl-CoA reductase-like NADH-dependent reductase (Old Yellow Enzyme family)